jgi:hypothetical protein
VTTRTCEPGDLPVLRLGIDSGRGDPVARNAL